jgi:hypothetical protein
MKTTNEKQADWEAFDQSFKSGLELPDNDVEDVRNDFPDEAKWGHSKFWLVAGNGEVTNPDPEDKKACGRFYGVKGCLHVENHGIVFNNAGVMEDHTGQIYWHKKFRWCNGASCPICFKWGYSVREARVIEVRLAEGSKKHGKVLHIIVSGSGGILPEEQYDFDEEYNRVRLALEHRGIFGGVIIFHAFRYHQRDETYAGEPPQWFWSPHWHILGYIMGGYGKCRNCPNNKGDSNIISREKCLACGGFEGKNRKWNEKDLFIVKVKDERKSVFWTAWYQLNHASIRKDAEHWRIPRWFGVVSYRKLRLMKGDKETRHAKCCPSCGEQLVDIKYVGRGEPLDVGKFYVQNGWDTYLDEDGSVKWILKPSNWG